MFIQICVVLSYAVLAFLLICLVGYWTAANYYFKLNKDLVGILAVINAIAWFFWIFITLLDKFMPTQTEEPAYNFAYGIVGIVNMVVLSLFIGTYAFTWFEKSRNYFWKKRGR